MRRRIAYTIAAVVSIALLVAGIGVSLILRANIQHEAVRQLSLQAQAIANRVQVTNTRSFRVIRFAAALDGAKLIPLNPSTGTPLRPLPVPLAAQTFANTDFVSGFGQSGVYANVAYAAVPIHTPASASASSLTLLVLTRALPPTQKANLFLLLVILVSILAAFVVAELLTYRFAKPMLAIVDTTSDIAKGHFEVRVPESGSGIKEFAQLAASINTMAEKLSEASESERQFLLAISHDLRTPLTSIRGYAEGISDETLDPKSAAATIMAQSDRLARLVGDLLDLAKIRASAFSLTASVVSPSVIADQMAKVFEPRIKDAAVNFTYRPVSDEYSTSINVDPDRVVQILSNLLENAYKFASSTVVLSCLASASEVTFAVTDDGPGISSDARGVLFEKPYQRGDTRSRANGSGLGLLISAQLTRAMGGAIDFVSPPTDLNSGTEMRVSFPNATPTRNTGIFRNKT